MQCPHCQHPLQPNPGTRRQLLLPPLLPLLYFLPYQLLLLLLAVVALLPWTCPVPLPGGSLLLVMLRCRLALPPAPD
jgi:hypothetical protein